MSSLQGRINFLIGAGASTGFSIPSMKGMPDKFSDELYNYEDKNMVKLFDNLRKAIESKLGNDSFDIEMMMSIIINQGNRNKIENELEDYTLFLIRYFDLSLDKMLGDYTTQTYLDLTTAYKKFIRKMCIIEGEGITQVIKVYKNLFDHFTVLLREPENLGKKYPSIEEQFMEFGNTMIFTTNYDTAIELYCEQMGYPSLDTGAIRDAMSTRKIIEVDEFLKRYVAKQSRLRLIKLHGSVNWFKNNEQKLEEGDYHMNLDKAKKRYPMDYVVDDVIIYPLSQKELYHSPFAQFFSVFDTELRKNKLWIIIGYSFRDLFIRKMFENNIGTVEKIILVHPDPDKVRMRFNDETNLKIIEIKSKFGMDNFDEVNKVIMKTVKDLT
jgi:hypothetical protein